MRPFIALILVMSLAFQAVLAGPRDIMGVEEVRVETPVGTLPRLPYRLRVTYSDGSSELRQVRWADEDPAREAGSEYRVNGYLSGDNSSPEGYPQPYGHGFHRRGYIPDAYGNGGRPCRPDRCGCHDGGRGSLSLALPPFGSKIDAVKLLHTVNAF